jgi:hypothetical protein
MSPTLKLATELVGIVERAVVHECDFARAVEVGMGIFVGFASVGGPTGVCEADVMAFGCDGAFFDEVKSVGVFSDRCVLGNSLY